MRSGCHFSGDLKVCLLSDDRPQVNNSIKRSLSSEPSPQIEQLPVFVLNIFVNDQRNTSDQPIHRGSNNKQHGGKSRVAKYPFSSTVCSDDKQADSPTHIAQLVSRLTGLRRFPNVKDSTTEMRFSLAQLRQNRTNTGHGYIFLIHIF